MYMDAVGRQRDRSVGQNNKLLALEDRPSWIWEDGGRLGCLARTRASFWLPQLPPTPDGDPRHPG